MLALAGCADKKSDTEKQRTKSPAPTIQTTRKIVTGEWVGRTLLPRSGETVVQYEGCSVALNEANKNLSRGSGWQPILSILTEQGRNMYTWDAKAVMRSKTGSADSFDPAQDPNLIMAAQMAWSGTVYRTGKTATTGPEEKPQQVYRATVRRGRFYDF